jgi:hypothetical protein
MGDRDGTVPHSFLRLHAAKARRHDLLPGQRSLVVRVALDREIQVRGLDNDVQLTTCGCMGLCDEGPVRVVCPAGGVVPARATV